MQPACPLAAPVVILTLNAAVVAGLKTVAMKIHLLNLLVIKSEMMHKNKSYSTKTELLKKSNQMKSKHEKW